MCAILLNVSHDIARLFSLRDLAFCLVFGLFSIVFHRIKGPNFNLHILLVLSVYTLARVHPFSAALSFSSRNSCTSSSAFLCVSSGSHYILPSCYTNNLQKSHQQRGSIGSRFSTQRCFSSQFIPSKHSR